MSASEMTDKELAAYILSMQSEIESYLVSGNDIIREAAARLTMMEGISSCPQADEGEEVAELKSKELWEKYSELKRMAEERGLNTYDNHSLAQYRHLVQAMETAKAHFRSYMREMHNWLKNIERTAVDEIESQSKEKGSADA